MKWVCAGCRRPMKELKGMMIHRGKAWCFDCIGPILDDIWARIHEQEAQREAQRGVANG